MQQDNRLRKTFGSRRSRVRVSALRPKPLFFYAKQRFFATFLKFIRTSVLVIILAFVESAKLYNILAQEVNEMG
jgi:hypothetical protein